jgi:AraC-like DNA-binding protein
MQILRSGRSNNVTDVLAQVLSALRITTTLFAMANLPEQWGVAFPQGQGAYFHVLHGSDGWLHTAGESPLRVGSGDTVLLARGTAHQLTSDPDGTVATIFDPVTWSANAIVPASAGPAPSGATLVCGAVDVENPATHPLLDLLPAVLKIGSDDPGATDLELTLRLLRRETRAVGPGSQILLARLGDVLLVQLVRIWVEREGLGRGSWLGALRDPQIGPAIIAMHADPGEHWTVDSLAAIAHLSRSRFAERFTTLVGQAPLGYLTQWRLGIAVSLLSQGRSIRDVSRSLGYTSEPAFSRAFTRRHGRPPSTYHVGSERPPARRGSLRGKLTVTADWDSDEVNEAIARDFGMMP